MLADLDIPISILTGWLPGMIGFLFVVLLLLGIWNAGKKAFGLKPPLDDQFKQIVKTLRGEIIREKNSTLKEYKLKLQPVVERVDRAEADILEVKGSVSELRDKMETNKKEILEAGSNRGKEIYTHVDNVRKELSNDINSIPDRIIATLKNTGAI